MAVFDVSRSNHAQRLPCIYGDMIRKTPKGYVLYSKSTPRKRLGGPYKSREEAVKRERQVQFFKRKG